jgi:hypothetical protein
MGKTYVVLATLGLALAQEYDTVEKLIKFRINPHLSQTTNVYNITAVTESTSNNAPWQMSAPVQLGTTPAVTVNLLLLNDQ